VYKLAAVRAPAGAWQPRLKRSEQATKTSIPGILQVRRYARGGRLTRDVIVDELHAPAPDDAASLLVPAFRRGERVRAEEPLAVIRDRACAEVAALPPDVARLTKPARYPVELEPGLAARREALLRTAVTRDA
jgi:nicotinate phosphoribosyltransferase